MPSSKNYKRDYKQEQKTARKRGDTKRRALRNKARRAAIKAGKAKKGDGKDIGHKRPLSKGGSGSLKNTKVQSREINRQEGGRIGSKAGKARGGRKGKKK
jgi:hypothetical protein